MKTMTLAMIFGMAALSSCGPSIQSTDVDYHVSASVGYGTFYDALSPYGRWFDYPGYGRVWTPSVEIGFSPYATNGRWVYSADGWVWASGYSWGWAPFHYGRWLYDGPYGWIWVPGSEWAPAWVTWGSCNGYYGWSPMMPHGGVSVSAYWNFVPSQHINQVNVNNYIVHNNTTVVNNLTKNVTIINNNNYYAGGDNRQVSGRAVYNRGPEVHEVEKATGQRINPIVLQTTGKPGQQLNDRRLAIYRPVIREDVSKQQPVTNQLVQNKQVAPAQPQQNNPVSSMPQQERRVDPAPQQNRRIYDPQSREQGKRYYPVPPASRQQDNRRYAPAQSPQQDRRYNRMPQPVPSGNGQGRGNENDTRKSRKKED